MLYIKNYKMFFLVTNTMSIRYKRLKITISARIYNWWVLPENRRRSALGRSKVSITVETTKGNFSTLLQIQIASFYFPANPGHAHRYIS